MDYQTIKNKTVITTGRGIWELINYVSMLRTLDEPEQKIRDVINKWIENGGSFKSPVDWRAIEASDQIRMLCIKFRAGKSSPNDLPKWEKNLSILRDYVKTDLQKDYLQDKEAIFKEYLKKHFPNRSSDNLC